jgi:hypothetical protein
MLPFMLIPHLRRINLPNKAVRCLTVADRWTHRHVHIVVGTLLSVIMPDVI